MSVASVSVGENTISSVITSANVTITISTDSAATTGCCDYDSSNRVDDEIVHVSVEIYPQMLVALSQPITDWNTSEHTREAYVQGDAP